MGLTHSKGLYRPTAASILRNCSLRPLQRQDAEFVCRYVLLAGADIAVVLHSRFGKKGCLVMVEFSYCRLCCL